MEPKLSARTLFSASLGECDIDTPEARIELYLAIASTLKRVQALTGRDIRDDLERAIDWLTLAVETEQRRDASYWRDVKAGVQ